MNFSIYSVKIRQHACRVTRVVERTQMVVECLDASIKEGFRKQEPFIISMAVRLLQLEKSCLQEIGKPASGGAQRILKASSFSYLEMRPFQHIL